MTVSKEIRDTKHIGHICLIDGNCLAIVSGPVTSVSSATCSVSIDSLLPRPSRF